MTTIFHVSDLHFGWPAVPEQIEAIEQTIQAEHFDVVAISGDLSQRARAGEFQRAAVFIRDAAKVLEPGFAKVLSWYDNEMGFSARMGDVIAMIAKSL